MKFLLGTLVGLIVGNLATMYDHRNDPSFKSLNEEINTTCIETLKHCIDVLENKK